MEGTSPNVQGYACECGRFYKSKSGLSNHRRKTCPNTAERSAQMHECKMCHEKFLSYQGLRLHEQRIHPDEYNAEIENAREQKKKAFPRDDLIRMAKLELECPDKYANRYIASRWGTPIKLETIKYRRTTNEYREILGGMGNCETLNQQTLEKTIPEEATRLEGKENSNDAQEHVPEQAQLMNQDPEDGGRCAEGGSGTDPIITHLLAMDPEYLDEQDNMFIKKLTEEPSQSAQWIEEWWSVLAGGAVVQRPARGVRHRDRPRKAELYREAQSLFRKDKKRLFGLLREGRLGSEQQEPDVADSYKFYYDQWNAGLTGNTIRINEHHGLLGDPITTGEILRALNGMASKAIGPDGISLRKINAWGPARLAILANAMLLTGTVPSGLRMCRTVLIPKTSGSGRDVGNYRPITVSSLVMRIINRVWARRLSEIPTSTLQRGFKQVDGCLSNLMAFHHIIKNARRKRTPYSIATLDIKSAFDRISHEAIAQSLRKKNVSSKVINYVLANMKAYTSIRTQGGTSDPIELCRGVKQGDPMSPAIFNICLDDMFGALEGQPGLELTEGRHVPVLAFADDLILMSHDQQGIQDSINKVAEHLKRLGLQLNPTKCAALSVEKDGKGKKLYVRTGTALSFEGVPLKQVRPTETIKYLGQYMSFRGAAAPMLEEAERDCAAVRGAPLKPHQKLVMIKEHVLPRLIFKLQYPGITKHTLKRADHIIRTATKRVLHLPRTTADAVLYAPERNGGLGLFCLTSRIPSVLLERLVQLGDGDDFDRAVGEACRPLMERLQKMGGVGKETNGQMWSAELADSYSGTGITHEMGQAETSWIKKPPNNWNGGTYIKAIQMRYNLLPTVGIPSNPTDRRRCRAGCDRTESLSHVVQGCYVTHDKRIQRHNHVCALTARIARKNGWTVEEEPRIRLQTGELKIPDLLLVKEERAVIVDVAIAWESGLSLNRASQQKIEKYNITEINDRVRQRTGAREVLHTPLVMGARGHWSRTNNLLTEECKFSAVDIAKIVTDTMLGGIACHTFFSRAVWRPRQGPLA